MVSTQVIKVAGETAAMARTEDRMAETKARTATTTTTQAATITITTVAGTIKEDTIQVRWFNL